MPHNDLSRAQETIGKIQSMFESFRKETYKTVHDKIGSTLSAVSIKVKLLNDKTTDPIQKKAVTEIHSIIKECLAYVTTLNRELKQNWIPQSTTTFLDDLQKEVKEYAKTYEIIVDMSVANHDIKKITYSDVTLMYEWVFEYIKNCIPRLASSLNIHVKIKDDFLEWTFVDDAPMEAKPSFFDKLLEKTTAVHGTFQVSYDNHTNTAVLTLPMRVKHE